MRIRPYLLIAPLILLAVSESVCGEKITLDTSSLTNWKPITFPWVPRHTSYTISKQEDAIHIQSDNAASGMQYTRVFDTYADPVVHFSWKVMNVIPNGNAATKSGDDYAARIYIMFPYDNAHLSSSERLGYDFLKGLLGYYPPSYILSFVWANRPHSQNPMPNAFSDRGAMFFLDTGEAHLGQWRSHTVNIVDAFRRAYHKSPPPTFTLAVMGDTDNTHGSTDAYVRNVFLQPADAATLSGRTDPP